MKKVFLVDDMDMFNFILKKIISRVSDQYQIHVFADPVKAYSMLDEVRPDLIFLDLNMPVMDGWDFLRKMKEVGNLTRVIILTSSNDETDKIRSLEYANVECFITKPVNFHDVELLLKNIKVGL